MDRAVAVERVGILGRLTSAARWYGAEGYMTMVGGLIVFAIITISLLSAFYPGMAPYNPEKALASPSPAPVGST